MLGYERGGEGEDASETGFWGGSLLLLPVEVAGDAEFDVAALFPTGWYEPPMAFAFPNALAMAIPPFPTMAIA